ncbi:Zim17-type zinc finger-containing protein [Dictyostelium discoideum AX4]|uniref:Zim17-type zinc finger-containing protein n=1 Tax=Dictyostelium discoideum TaxID=44689 RepID=Q54CL5_DICDI|nr:Zim17-type zinc finger-containing protein [Dictyostelium discoideum AX4]EAL60958.1 Zim17-type zinc finger-containing protein [Dictyostelium discoideum AX4]|eukprot:XP_629401.1 Zim17-type zinc finger-containing protein [Dictyostelium discoideum AX4]
MKRFISNVSKQILIKNPIIKNNNNCKIINSFSNIYKQQPLQKPISSLFNNNFKNYNQRFYCEKQQQPNNSESVTNAEIDHHGEDTENEFKPVVVDGVRIEPKYYIEFTCTYVDPKLKTECGFVSKKTFSKHSYHKGVVLIRCDGCKKIHTIADNLGWTGYENAKNIEEIMAEKGETVRRYLLKQDEIEDEKKSDEPVLIGSSNKNEEPKK